MFKGLSIPEQQSLYIDCKKMSRLLEEEGIKERENLVMQFHLVSHSDWLG